MVLARADGAIYALGDHCPHLGGPLSKGHLSGGQIICPWHGSRFDLGTGTCRRGPETGMFPEAGAYLDAGKLQALGQALQTRQAQLRHSRLIQARHGLKRETLRLL